MSRFSIVIPARYASTRFPGKPLAKIGGVEMIVRVCMQASKVCDSVHVATDDERIARCVEHAGFNAIMTGKANSGTDRVWQAVENAGINSDIIINIQGDEPFIDPEQIKTLMSLFDDPKTDIATLARPFDAAAGYDALADPNLVKVVFGNDGRAMYFSRSVIPYLRGVQTDCWPQTLQYYTHIGIYAYRRDVLEAVTRMPQSSLEKDESLEQLRWLQAGIVVSVGLSDRQTIGIDTPEDLESAEQYFKKLHGVL